MKAVLAGTVITERLGTRLSGRIEIGRDTEVGS